MLASALFGVVGVHTLLLLGLTPQPVAVSRLATAAVPLLAALCIAWRARRLPAREQAAWRWMGVALSLWAAGQVVETLLGQSTAASNLAVDASDFLYVTAAFPLLLAVSSTRETESVRAVFYLDSAQVAVAFVLAYVRLYRMAMPAEQAATVMATIYGGECALLAFFAVLRLVTWSTLEERRRIRLLCAVLWIYLPIELAMDYATKHWSLQAGTMLDLVWSVPFLFAGWQALKLPTTERLAAPRQRLSRARLLVESLCPGLITVGVFLLAASTISQHPILALSAMLLLLLIQGLHAGLVQLNYLNGQNLLMKREEELQEANAALERLSQEDSLTGIANRRCFDAAFEDVWRRAVRRQEPLAVLMIDVDLFKAINDRHGHAFGDECLVSIARLLARHAGRPDDLLARYGGEEFILLLPETSLSGAMAVAERLRYAVFSTEVANEASPFEQRLTVSVGIGACSPQVGKEPSHLIEAADQALYEAKRLGRNRICARAL
jgi:diguanylate cyclase (GGDEF)-like protein